MSTAITREYTPGFYEGDRPKVVTSRFEYEDSHTIERFEATGGYAGLKAALAMGPEAMSGEVKQEHASISTSQKQFNEQLDSLNRNLAELNTAYAEQVKGSNDHLQGTSGVYKGLNEMITNLQSSVEETQKYKSEIVKLSESLSELNNVYGNMLTAMSIRKK